MIGTSAQFPGITYVDGDAASHPLSAARVFNPMDAAMQTAMDKPCAIYVKTANVSVAHAGSGQAISFDAGSYPTDSQVYDNDSIWSSSHPTRLTAKHAGRYIITANGCFDVNAAAGRAQIRILLNGTTCIAKDSCDLNTTENSPIAVSIPWFLNVNDYVEMIVYQDATGSMNLLAGSGTTVPLILFSIACQGL